MEEKNVAKKSNNKTRTNSGKTDSKKNVKKTGTTKSNSSRVSKAKSTVKANKSTTSKAVKKKANVKEEKSDLKESAKSSKSTASKVAKKKANVKKEKNELKESAKTSKSVESSSNNNIKKEKKVCSNGIYWVIAFLIIVAIIVCTYNIISERNNRERNDTLFFITESFETKDDINLNETIQTLSRFKEIFGDLDVAYELDFINHNYAILELEYNPCRQEKLTPNIKRIFGKDIDVDVSFNAKCGDCSDENVYYLIVVNKNTSYVNVNVNYKQNTYVLCK